MTAINLPGQLEVPLIVDHSRDAITRGEFREMYMQCPKPDLGRGIAQLLTEYEERPTSETWSRIQALAKEILK